MTLRRARAILWISFAALLLASAGAIVAALLLPLDVDPPAPVGAAAPGGEEPGPAGPGLPSLDDLLRLADRRLRGPLFDPPPAPPPKPVPKPPPRVALVGTVLDPVSPRALVRDPDDRVRLKKVGDRLGDDANFATIVRIEADRLEMEQDGAVLELKVQKPGRRR